MRRQPTTQNNYTQVINNFYNSISNSGSVDKAELIEHIKAAIAAKSKEGTPSVSQHNGRSK